MAGLKDKIQSRQNAKVAKAEAKLGEKAKSLATTTNRAEGGTGEDIISSTDINQKIDILVASLDEWATFVIRYEESECFRKAVQAIYVKHNTPEQKTIGKTLVNLYEGAGALVTSNQITDWRGRAQYVYFNHRAEAKVAYRKCAEKKYTKGQTKTNINIQREPNTGFSASRFSRPFDDRLERLLLSSDYDTKKDKNDGTSMLAAAIMPYDTRFMDATTIGYLISVEGMQSSMKADDFKAQEEQIKINFQKKKEELSQEPYYKGVPSLINTYSLTRLYGSEGGAYLVDKKGQRKWYEIDSNDSNIIGYSKVPTTSSIIEWGEGDKYGRTPYHFTDFVFCKYWGIIPNNRLITLRRYPAPIVDNLNFPTIDGRSPEDYGEKAKPGTENLAEGALATADKGSSSKVNFPPMATAITYFGEETGNTLSSILKFTTGMTWEEIEAAVHDVTLTQNPNAAAGPGGINGTLDKFAKTLNLVTGNYNANALLNKEQLPPDPYTDGPYENRVIGPVNAITKVYKRSRGIEYTNEIPLVFEYTARPIGGINSKAVLLDILSNFLLIGSVSAMFWGGQHRFTGQPQGYPFIGGSKAMASWYQGKPLEWGKETIKTFVEQGQQAGNIFGDFFKSIQDLFKGAGDFFKTGTLPGAGSNKPGGGNLLSNIVTGWAAERSSGQIPYLQGHKALLTGEPVGEWHVTIGNPLNPIALIGNLICKNMEVEFGEELGPDDFPLSIKVTVNLTHGMARDRDAIQSMFNRGMGRIYSLPDNFSGSADFETKVDANTGNRNVNGRVKTRYGGSTKDVNYKGTITEPSNKSNPTVWNRLPFISVSDDHAINFRENIQARSEFRSATWISEKSLK